jgi:hypothetical protein
VIFSLTLAIAAVGAGCTTDAAPGADPADYRAALASLCTASATERSALDQPDDAGVATFARAVADILTLQADTARALRPPKDLDDDHRAFVQNTADQASRWTGLATTSPEDVEQFGALQTAILELTLGRDDLATAMDVPECRVQP